MSDQLDLITLTAEISSSFVANNRIGANEVAGVIQSVHAALAGLGAPAPTPQPERPEPAVPIRKSIQPDYLVNLFTGRKLKTLKRNLATSHGMTPAEYRAYWGLPDSYPMVAPNYSESRKTMAKAIGLGRKAGAAALETVVAAAESVVEAVTPAKRPGRPRKAAAPAEPAAAAKPAEAKPAAGAKPPRKPRTRKPAPEA